VDETYLFRSGACAHDAGLIVRQWTDSSQGGSRVSEPVLALDELPAVIRCLDRLYPGGWIIRDGAVQEISP
jgi:hypothetical protein